MQENTLEQTLTQSEIELLKKDIQKYESVEEWLGVNRLNPRETKIVWQANRQGSQVIGNKQVIRKPTLEDFKNDILRLTREGYYGTGKVEQQYKTMLKKEPNLTVSYIDTGDGWKISKVDDFDNIILNVMYGIEQGWAKKVDDFESSVAKIIRKTFDENLTLKDIYNQLKKQTQKNTDKKRESEYWKLKQKQLDKLTENQRKHRLRVVRYLIKFYKAKHGLISDDNFLIKELKLLQKRENTKGGPTRRKNEQRPRKNLWDKQKRLNKNDGNKTKKEEITEEILM